MNVSLTEEMAKFVETEIASGDYVSASEVVRDALRILRHERQMEAEELRALRAEVQVGLDALERGDFSDQSLDDIYADMLREHQK